MDATTGVEHDVVEMVTESPPAHENLECCITSRDASGNTLAATADATQVACQSTDCRDAKDGDARDPAIVSHVEPDRPELVIDWTTDTVNEVFARLAAVLRDTGRFYGMGGMLVVVDDAGTCSPVPARDFNAHVHRHVEVKQQQGIVARYGLLSARTVGAFVNSPDVIRAHFPEIVYFSKMPAVVDEFRVIATPGYDPASRVYYAGPRIEPSADRSALDELCNSFLWHVAADAVNYLGWLLTLVTVFLWPGRHPFTVFNANRPRLGKSTAARAVGILVEGKQPRSISYTENDSDLENRIATIVREGASVLLVDNAKRGKAGVIASAVLERCITDRVLNFRKLRTNSSITATNYLAVMVTMNEAKFGPDLMQRSLPINLFLEEDPRDHIFAHDNIEDYVLEHREEILAALLGMVVAWREAGCPPSDDPPRHTISQNWAPTIDAILRHAGYFGFLTNFVEAQRSFDPDVCALNELAAAFDKEPMTPTQWAAWIEDFTPESSLAVSMSGQRARGKATRLGRLLNRVLGQTVERDGKRYRLMCEAPIGHHSRRYHFEQVPAEVQPNGGA